MPSFSQTVLALLLLSLGVLIPGQASARPLLNEFLANNGSTLEDEDGESSDWIEIHNPDPVAIDLGGYGLTDDPAQPLKWTFPAGTILAPGGYLVVFASAKDRAAVSQELHCNFALNSSGDYLAFTDPGGGVLQEFAPEYPNQRRDISYGMGNTATLGYLDPPTPNSANGAPLSGFVEDTVFSLKRGFYTDPISVEITTLTPGASIRYTTDGTKPTPSSGVLYNGPIAISSTTVLRAMAYQAGMVPTNVDAQSYLFVDDILTQPEMNPSITNSATYSAEIPGSLQALPVVSLSFDNSDLFGGSGIYNNPTLSGRTSEREVHFEFFDPSDPENSTHEPAGVRIHGGNARLHPKKALRLYFRDDYGKPRLRHDIFPGSPVDSFKNLLLRGGGHDAWTFRREWNQATLIRNEFLHRLQLEMGNPSPRGRFVNVFLNGQYWGVYELQELPYEHYNADHHGGAPEDWDVIKHGEEVEAGDASAWNQLLAVAAGGINTTSDYQAIQEFIDIDHFADAMIHRIWSSDEDWLGPIFRGNTNISVWEEDKNWYVGRRSRNGTSKFYFYAWDAEMSMGIPFAASRSWQNDLTRVSTSRSPGAIYNALRNFPEFQIRFADRLHKHLFNGGALTTARTQAIWDVLADDVRSPMVAESARWGLEYWTGSRSIPYTRDGQWTPAQTWVRNQYLANRSNTVLNQFRAIGLYPNVEAPVFAPYGADSPNPINVLMVAPTSGSTIYYTTDGSDPRLPEESSIVNLLSDDAPAQAIVPTAAMDAAIGTTWKNPADPANIGDWHTGRNGVGYETSPGSNTSFAEFIDIDLAPMQGVNSSAYIRLKFNIPDQATIDSLTSLTLRMRYDDGFIAYLNGTLLLGVNAGSTEWNAFASASHPDNDAVTFVAFDQTSNIGLLTPGENVLAIHGLNRTITSGDFLIQAVLDGDTGSSGAAISPSAAIWNFSQPVGESTFIRARARTAAGEWSALNEALYKIGTPATATNLTITELHYHPANPTTPDELALSTNDKDFEFFELYNKSTGPIDLTGCRFSRGIDFDFPVATGLAAGARALLVSNEAAFLSRYGNGLRDAIVGEFANDTNLSNRGEDLTLLDAEGNPIFDFEFDDSAPWPEQADGAGPSLVVIDPVHTANTDLALPGVWRTASLVHGAPGLADEMSYDLWRRLAYGPLGGSDDAASGELVSPPGSAGLPNLALYAQGQDITNGDPAALTTLRRSEGGEGLFPLAILEYQARTDLPDVTITPQISTDLVTWTDLEDGAVRGIDHGDGTTTFTVEQPLEGPDAETDTFIRLFFSR